jgi:hypothetical protein
MYEGNSPWVREPTPDNPTRIVSLGLPALIASEKARMVTLEMKTEINAPMAEIAINPAAQQMPEQPMPADDRAAGSDTTSNLGTNEGNATGAGQPNVVPGGANSIPMSSAFAQKTQQVPTGPTERAEYLNGQYKKVIRQIRRQLEYGIAKGGLVVKPYVVRFNTTPKFGSAPQSDVGVENTQNTAQNEQKNSSVQNTTKDANNAPAALQNAPAQSNNTLYANNLLNAEIEFDFIQADRFFPLAFDANGKVIEAAFIQTKADKAKERVYIRLEYHKLENRTVTVQNLAFESTDMGLANSNNIKSASNLGKQIPLTAVP